MVFKFHIISDEVDNFKREIKIDADATFLDFYGIIIDCTGFSDKEMSSFILTDEKWRKKQEITLVEMDTDSDVDSLVMEECVLNDFLEDEKQKLLFEFDYLNERSLFIELAEIIPGKNLKKPLCSISEGEAPMQTITPDDEKPEKAGEDLGESFFGDESFDIEELDKEGYDGLDELEDIPADSDSIDLY